MNKGQVLSCGATVSSDQKGARFDRLSQRVVARAAAGRSRHAQRVDAQTRQLCAASLNPGPQGRGAPRRTRASASIVAARTEASPQRPNGPLIASATAAHQTPVPRNTPRRKHAKSVLGLANPPQPNPVTAALRHGAACPPSPSASCRQSACAESPDEAQLQVPQPGC